MKIEIEVAEAEIKGAIERKARLAVAEYNDRKWLNDPVISASIKKYWTEAVDKIIKEQIENSDAIRQSVIKKIESRIQSQVTALMKVKK